MTIPFRPPLLTDRAAVSAAAAAAGAKENDMSFVNLYLLRRKYGTALAFSGGMLLRRYAAGYRVDSYGFPIGSGDLRAALSLLYADAYARETPLRLTLLTQAQCDMLSDACPGQFRFEPAEQYTEYLYLRENLAEMRGSRYHGKRNHIAQFWRAYPDACIQPLIAENVHFAVEIAEKWLAYRTNPAEPSLQAEYGAIQEAAANWDALGLSGLLLYAEGHPIGMTAVSELSPGVYDVHFEKVLPAFPHAWPVVANEMAKCLPQAEYLNREEDLGENGMRTSKTSYRPDLLQPKFNAIFAG